MGLSPASVVTPQRLASVIITGCERRGQEMKIHPGIRIDKIPIKGPAGLILTVGMLIIFLIGLPVARWFLALSVPLGVIIGVILRLTCRD